MDKKAKAQKLLERLKQLEANTSSGLSVSNDESASLTDRVVREEMTAMEGRMKDSSTLRGLSKLNDEIKKLKDDFNFQEIIDLITSSQGEMEQEYEQRLNDLKKEFEAKDTSSAETRTQELANFSTKFDELKNEFEGRRNEVETLGKTVEDQINTLLTEVADAKNLVESKSGEAESKMASLEGALKSSDKQILSQAEEKIATVQSDIETFKEEIRKRIASIQSQRGAQANRQIFIGGVDPLSLYTDLNIKAGSNVTITYANNNTTKKVDVTISATGGGSGAGITRSINSVSVPTTAGNSSSVDYVYLVSGTTTITLPDAAANTNLYTIKNVGTGIVTVNTTSSQTIDGSLTITLPVQYTSVDIESDTANWNVT